MATAQSAVEELADHLWELKEELVARLVQTTLTEIGALDHDAATRSLLEASITENIVAAVNYLRRDIDSEDAEAYAPTAALAYARVLAQRDIPQTALIRAYRIGHAQFLDLVFAQVEATAAGDSLPLVQLVVRRSGQYVDQICEQVGRAYERERERWVASRSGVRQQWVNQLLSGVPLDQAAAERALRYPLDALHVAISLWSAAPMSPFDLIAAVEDVRAHAASALRAHATLVVPTDEREARLWLALPEASRDHLAALTAPEGGHLHAAIGRPAANLTGFRASARQAAQVKELVATPRGGASGLRAGGERRPRWVRYDEVAAIVLMAGDLPALRDFVATTLGDLARRGLRGETLRETLRIFLAHHRSYAATAASVNLHRNSVQYRVQQATALLPHGADSLVDDFDIRAALLAAHWLGDAVLV